MIFTGWFGYTIVSQRARSLPSGGRFIWRRSHWGWYGLRFIQDLCNMICNIKNCMFLNICFRISPHFKTYLKIMMALTCQDHLNEYSIIIVICFIFACWRFPILIIAIRKAQLVIILFYFKLLKSCVHDSCIHKILLMCLFVRTTIRLTVINHVDNVCV